MDTTPILHINMLGGCSLSYGDSSIDDARYHAKKPWTLLEYLIAFRSREIPLEELADLLYAGEGGASPTGALKTLVYRARMMLEELGVPNGKDMILAARGSYAWNNSVPIALDVDRFELACQRVSSPGLLPEEKLSVCLEALELYRGDFLPQSAGEKWVMELSAYYHSLYVHLVQTAVEQLFARERWEEAAAVCARATAIDAYQASFHFHLVRALVRTGRRRQALEQYRRMYALFCTELGAAPSAEMAALYREIGQAGAGTGGEPAGDLTAVSSFLLREDPLAGAFFCELEVFRNIYLLESRAVTRSRQGVCLALLSASMRDGTPPPLKLLNDYMDKLAECIQTTLRRGDVVSKYSVSQYVLLLPAPTAESGALALGRVISRFVERYPRCPLLLRPSVQAIGAAS